MSSIHSHDEESNDPSVSQLAAEADAAKPPKEGQKGWISSLFGKIVLPMGVVAVVILIINVLAVVLPLALILTDASDTGLNHLVDKTMQVNRISVFFLSSRFYQGAVKIPTLFR